MPWIGGLGYSLVFATNGCLAARGFRKNWRSAASAVASSAS